MARFIPTLPQWPCSGCRKLITQHRAYCVSECRVAGGTRVVGIQRKRRGAYCVACATRAAQAEEAAPPPLPAPTPSLLARLTAAGSFTSPDSQANAQDALAFWAAHQATTILTNDRAYLVYQDAEARAEGWRQTCPEELAALLRS
jgi:hypothetical protein